MIFYKQKIFLKTKMVTMSNEYLGIKPNSSPFEASMGHPCSNINTFYFIFCNFILARRQLRVIIFYLI